MILDGKNSAKKVEAELSEQLSQLTGRPPSLSVLLIGADPASQLYVNSKVRACERIGIHSHKIEMEATITQERLLSEIDQLNNDDGIDGILLQLPLPPHLDATEAIQRISPEKDVDGLHPYNMGRLLLGDPAAIAPCTPLGIVELLKEYQIDAHGMHCTIVGRSNIVGKPTAALLMQNAPGRNATVTVVHRFSRDFGELCRQADLLIVAMGQPHLIQPEMVKQGAVVIDVGINRIADSTKARGYRVIGDTDFDSLQGHCRAITPVPGGVGPMTIAMLLKNTLTCYRARHEL